MKKILTFLLGAGLFFLSGCFVQPPYFYEAVGKKDSIVSGDSQYPDLFIEKILSGAFLCPPPKEFFLISQEERERTIKENGILPQSMRSNDALFYNYVYIPYQDTTQVLNIIVSRYGKTSDKELILCGSGEYIFLLEDDKKARTLIIQQFCTKEHLPEDITSLLKHNPLPDTRYQRALERLFPIEGSST